MLTTVISKCEGLLLQVGVTWSKKTWHILRSKKQDNKKSSKRKDHVKYVDPVTGLTEYRYVEKVTYRYEDEEKVTIVIEFPTGETLPNFR